MTLLTKEELDQLEERHRRLQDWQIKSPGDIRIIYALIAGCRRALELEEEIERVKQVEFPARIEKVSNGWRKRVATLEARNGQLRGALQGTLSLLKAFTRETDAVAKAVWDEAEAALAGEGPAMTDIVERLRTLHREITECDGGECEMMVTVRHAADEIERLRAMLRSAMCLIHGLACPGCKAQGREMAAPGHCCRDADCDAGWYGIGCDEVKDFLEAADRLMPGTLAEIENPPLPRNERSPLPPAPEDGGETP